MGDHAWPDPGEKTSPRKVPESCAVICGPFGWEHMRTPFRCARYEGEHIELCRSGFGGQRYDYTGPEERDGRLTRCREENQPM